MTVSGEMTLFLTKTDPNLTTKSEKKIIATYLLQQNFGEKVADRLRAEAGEVGVESEDYVDESLFAQTWFTHNLVESGQIGQVWIIVTPFSSIFNLGKEH